MCMCKRERERGEREREREERERERRERREEREREGTLKDKQTNVGQNRQCFQGNKDQKLGDGSMHGKDQADTDRQA